jgi:4,5:9,10-diseco-3-hydroxy-5,9,17-trioxoandrosta-1(10),2-diene-4-oate hydrolase
MTVISDTAAGKGAAGVAPLAVRRIGRGAPVVCLHAIGHDADDFMPLASRLGDRFEFILVDWPGHGNSEPDHGPVTSARYAELLQQTLLLQRVDNPVIVGNSVGGGAAILYASRNPVHALVLCNSAGLVEVTAVVRRICRLFERFFAAGERRAFWFSWLYARYYRFVLPMPATADRRRAIIAQGETLAPLLRQAWAGFGQPEADLRAVAAALDMPIWVAWAQRDKVIPLRLCLPAIQRLKSHKLSRYDAGHAAFLEQPDKFAGDFRQWMAELPPRSP